MRSSSDTPFVLRYAYVINVAASLVVAGLTWFVPTPADMTSWVFHTLLATITWVVADYFGAALIFRYGLSGFTSELKQAYTKLLIGFLLVGVGFLQLPLMPLLHAEKTPWFAYGGVAIPFAVGIGYVYAGIRGFARLFGVRSILMSPWVLLGLVFMGGILSMFIPNGTPNVPISNSTLAISKFAEMGPILFNVATALLCLRTRKRAGSAYIPALAWLSVYLLSDSGGALLGFVIRFIQPGNNIIIDSGLAYVPYVFGSLALAKAATEFIAIRYGRDVVLPPDEQTFFGRPISTPSSTETVIDVITYIAGFASNANVIDPLLDPMRVMTATRDPGAFTDTEQEQLAHTYLRLERYLSEQEPVRHYSRQELHDIMRQRFPNVLTNNKRFADTILA
jgi:hypothetical protein